MLTPTRLLVTGASASMNRPGRMPATRQSAARKYIAASELASVSFACAAAGVQVVVDDMLLDADVLAVWVVFWGLYRHSRLIQRVHRETYEDYVQLLRGMLAQLLQDVPGARARRSARPPVDLRLAAIGLTALLDGLWLEWCLEPGTFKPAEAVALCEGWIASLRQRA